MKTQTIDSRSADPYVLKQVALYQKTTNLLVKRDCLYRLASYLNLLTPEQSTYSPPVGEVALAWLARNGVACRGVMAVC